MVAVFCAAVVPAVVVSPWAFAVCWALVLVAALSVGVTWVDGACVAAVPLAEVRLLVAAAPSQRRRQHERRHRYQCPSLTQSRSLLAVAPELGLQRQMVADALSLS